eukprot:5031068-Pleurochrysis_carterae.AAC.1
MGRGVRGDHLEQLDDLLTIGVLQNDVLGAFAAGVVGIDVVVVKLVALLIALVVVTLAQHVAAGRGVVRALGNAPQTEYHWRNRARRAPCGSCKPPRGVLFKPSEPGPIRNNSGSHVPEIKNDLGRF